MAEIRRRLDTLDDDDIRLLAEGDAPTPPADSALEYVRHLLDTRNGLARAMTPPPVEPAPAPPDDRSQPLERSQWERIPLAPDVELHIRRPLPRAQTKRVDRLVTIARELLEEDRA